MSNVQFISGGLANKVKEWQKISSDPWILSTESGYKIEFDETPFQYKIPLPIKLIKSKPKSSGLKLNQFYI